MMSRKGLRSVLSSVLQPALRSALWPSVGGDGVGEGDEPAENLPDGFLLMETDESLLLESGDKLLLE